MDSHFNESIHKLKQEAERMQASTYAQQTQNSGYLACDLEPRRDPLRERVNSQLRRAAGEARRADRLAELQILLDKHPEVARILDLVEDLKY